MKIIESVLKNIKKPLSKSPDLTVVANGCGWVIYQTLSNIMGMTKINFQPFDVVADALRRRSVFLTPHYCFVTFSWANSSRTTTYFCTWTERGCLTPLFISECPSAESSNTAILWRSVWAKGSERQSAQCWSAAKHSSRGDWLLFYASVTGQ